MAFKMRCPKCFGLDYSIERDNRTFGAVAQAFELVFHCRCGKQMFGEVLLKEYERQKRDFDTRGEISTETDERTRDLERLRQASADKTRRAESDGADADEDDAPRDEDEPKEDKRWRQRMAALTADDDEDDEDDDTPSPAPSRSRARKTAGPASKAAPTKEEPAGLEEPGEGEDAEPAPTKRSRATASADGSRKRAPASKAPAAKAKAEARAPVPLPAEDEDDEGDDLGEHDEESAEEEGADPTVCAWPGCTKPRRPNSKYCSRACSNKNARSRHKQRGRRPSRARSATTAAPAEG